MNVVYDMSITSEMLEKIEKEYNMKQSKENKKNNSIVSQENKQYSLQQPQTEQNTHLEFQNGNNFT